MKAHDIKQGSPEWHAYRAEHFNASDAPAMMGCSPYESRTALLHRLHTGIAPEVDAGTQRRFDDGHRFEALARPLAEEIIGEMLYPMTGSKGKLSASFDGLTDDYSIAFEHKSLNGELRAIMVEGRTGAALPLMYRVQMEQQCMVSGAARVLFMASKWDGDTLVEERHCWYTPDLKLRAEIFAGWVQFEEDAATYVPPAAAAPAPAAKKIDTLPALRVDVTAMVTASNLDAFKTVAMAAINGVNRELNTDQEFADAKEAVKWFADVETRLKAAKAHILAQTGTLDDVLRAIDDIDAASSAARLSLDKLVTNREEQIKSDIITKARAAFLAYVAELQAEIVGATLAQQIPDFAEAAKGKRSIATRQDAVDTLMAQAKIAANATAKGLRDGLACIATEGAGYEMLFADRNALASKPVEDLRVLVKARIDAHKAAEAKREQDKKDEAARAAANAVITEAQHPQQVLKAEPATTDATDRGAVAIASQRVGAMGAGKAADAAPSREPATLNLGAINARLHPIKIDAAGLAKLCIVHSATDKDAKLYRESDFARLREALIEHLGSMREAVAA